MNNGSGKNNNNDTVSKQSKPKMEQMAPKSKLIANLSPTQTDESNDKSTAMVNWNKKSELQSHCISPMTPSEDES